MGPELISNVPILYHRVDETHDAWVIHSSEEGVYQYSGFWCLPSLHTVNNILTNRWIVVWIFIFLNKVCTLSGHLLLGANVPCYPLSQCINHIRPSSSGGFRGFNHVYGSWSFTKLADK